MGWIPQPPYSLADTNYVLPRAPRCPLLQPHRAAPYTRSPLQPHTTTTPNYIPLQVLQPQRSPTAPQGVLLVHYGPMGHPKHTFKAPNYTSEPTRPSKLHKPTVAPHKATPYRPPQHPHNPAATNYTPPQALQLLITHHSPQRPTTTLNDLPSSPHSPTQHCPPQAPHSPYPAARAAPLRARPRPSRGRCRGRGGRC